jgi:hypothetical protein
MPDTWLMTSPDLNDLMHTQEKLEWVTPKISLMKAETTDGRTYSYAERTRVQSYVGSYRYGPS